jgi:hypothetical protein
MLADGHPPAWLGVFGSPKTGMADFADRLKDIPGGSYRNGCQKRFYDMVTYVPVTLWPFDMFVHHRKQILTESPVPPAFEQLSMFAYHHIFLYQTAVKNYLATLMKGQAHE